MDDYMQSQDKVTNASKEVQQTTQSLQERGFRLINFVSNDLMFWKTYQHRTLNKTVTLSEFLDRSGIWEMTPSIWNHQQIFQRTRLSILRRKSLALYARYLTPRHTVPFDNPFQNRKENFFLFQESFSKKIGNLGKSGMNHYPYK